MIKISLFKSTADGEQLNTEWNLEPRDYDRLKKGESLRDILGPFFRLADQRLLEMNLRIMLSNKMVREQPPEFQVAYHNVMEVLHGQKPNDQTFIELLRKSVADTISDLVKQGVNRETVEKVVRSTYGDVALPPVEETPQEDRDGKN